MTEADGWSYRVQWCQFVIDKNGVEYSEVKRLTLYDVDEQEAREHCERLAQKSSVRDVQLECRRPVPRWEVLQL